MPGLLSPSPEPFVHAVMPQTLKGMDRSRVWPGSLSKVHTVTLELITGAWSIQGRKVIKEIWYIGLTHLLYHFYSI